MEPTTNTSREHATATGTATQPSTTSHTPTQQRTESARIAAPSKEAPEVIEQAKQAVTDAYDRTSQTVQHTYKQAVDYSRDNPMKTMLVVFGAGVGAGLLLAGSNRSGSRDRTSRIVPTVANALADVVTEIFR